MREFFLLFFTILLGINSAFAYDLVLPKEKKTIVNSNYAFFVGKAKPTESITINDERVYIATNGAFAHSIKLKDGENRIVVKSNLNTHVYRFYKNAKSEKFEPILEEFEPKNFIVKKDNTPLRNTPIDYGMNRISHLFEGTNLLINGKKGDFYRVFLTKNKEAWISKTAVEETNSQINPAFITLSNENFKNASKHTIEFTDKIPYTIEETSEEIVFKIYNPMVSDNTVYTINIKKPDKYYYNTTLENGKYTFKVTELPNCSIDTLEGLNIVIDPGHGGSEKGAIGCLGDEEKNINLIIANELRNLLANTGANVILTRECDANVSLEDRVKIAKENDTNIFISIHLNSIPDIEMNVHKNRGTSVYFYNPNSKALAKSLENSITKNLNTRKDGTKSASFAVIRPTEYIGVLIEVAYMTNPIDSVLYTKDTFPFETAKAITEGILNFVNSKQ